MTNKRNLPVLTDEEMAEKIRKSIENGERRMSKSSMKMISPGVEVEPDGTTKQILHVLFTDTEGNEVRYPWEGLKESGLEWIRIEQGDIPNPFKVGDKVNIWGQPGTLVEDLGTHQQPKDYYQPWANRYYYRAQKEDGGLWQVHTGMITGKICEEKPTIEEAISVQSVKAPSEFMLKHICEESKE